MPLIETRCEYVPRIEAALRIGAGDVVYDIGSGDGRVILALARSHPDAQFIGIERNPLLAAYSNMKGRRVANASFLRADMFDADLGDATHIYAYLMTKPLNDLYVRGKFGNARLASRAFKLSGRSADEVVALSETPGRHGEHLLHVYDL